MKSSILASRQAASISSCVTSDSGLVAPSKILKRIVPAYRVCRTSGQLSPPSLNITTVFTGSCDTSETCCRYS
jgi:hypothetical protein